MTAIQIIFIISALITIGASLMVVTVRNLIHAALWLIVAFFGVAIFYVLLNAGFFAVVQVVVYIGAIAILFIFAAMLTRRLMQDMGPQVNRGWWVGGIVSVGLFVALISLFSNWSEMQLTAPTIADASAIIPDLGTALVSANAYLIPFELASVLLVAAMIGAIYVSLEKKK